MSMASATMLLMSGESTGALAALTSSSVWLLISFLVESLHPALPLINATALPCLNISCSCVCDAY